MQQSVARGFNSSLYKLPFILDEELTNLSRFGVARAVHAATASVPAVDDATPAVGGGGWAEAGDLLSTLPALSTALLTTDDVAAAFGDRDPEAPLLPAAVDPFAVGVRLSSLDTLSPSASTILGQHAGKDSGFLAALLAGVQLPDSDDMVSLSQGARDLLQVLSTPRPALHQMARASSGPADAGISLSSTADAPSAVPASAPVVPTAAVASNGVAGAAASSLRGIMTEPVDDDFWRSSSDEDESDAGDADDDAVALRSPIASVVAAAAGGAAAFGGGGLGEMPSPLRAMTAMSSVTDGDDDVDEGPDQDLNACVVCELALCFC
jgi:hypothetical protein